MSADVLFPEFPPPPPPRKAADEFHASPDHKRILEVLERRGPKDEEELAAVLVGPVDKVASRVPKLLDELAKAGYVADTGQRAEKWRGGHRLIVWRWVKAAK